MSETPTDDVIKISEHKFVKISSALIIMKVACSLCWYRSTWSDGLWSSCSVCKPMAWTHDRTPVCSPYKQPQSRALSHAAEWELHPMAVDGPKPFTHLGVPPPLLGRNDEVGEKDAVQRIKRNCYRYSASSPFLFVQLFKQKSKPLYCFFHAPPISFTAVLAFVSSCHFVLYSGKLSRGPQFV